MGPLAEGEPSDEECTRCQRLRLNCDSEQPCHRCVKATPRIAGCHYRKSDGTYESWEVRPFQFSASGEYQQQELREDYENYIGRAKFKVPEGLQDLRNTLRNKGSKEESQSQVDETFDDDIDDENELSAIHETSKDKIKLFKFGLSAYNQHSLPPSYLELSGTSDTKYREAKEEELKSHEERGTWKVVPLPDGVKPVTSRWVNTDKYGPDGQLIKHKSRLVARGFQQEEGIDYEETFASVVKPASTRVLLALAAILSWFVHQGDVKTAFLNSELDKPVYMKAPKDIKLPRGFCLLLIKALYGLKQSPRAWYQKLRNTLISWGWRMSAYDPCVFISDSTGLVLEVHVDDINVMGKDIQAILDFKSQISQTFPMTDQGECSWYLGMHVEQKAGEIRIHQKKYIDQIVAKLWFQ